MKWNAIERTPDTFNFAAGDKLVAFAEQHHMRVRGHTLVWHNQLGQGVKELSGEALRAAMLRHVKATVTHWKGRISQWDVVNEALDDDGTLRKNSPFTALGKGYIADAFRAAHEADPNAQLFYNDYEAEGLGDAKSEAMYQLVKELKESGAPLHGVGFQMHVEPRQWPTAESIHKNLERFAALGLVVELTEIDVPVGELAGTPQQKLEEQRRIAHDMIAACWALPACSGVTLWGLTDRQSWLSSAEWGKLRGRGPHLPLPFDADYHPKPMFEGVAAALRGE
jgi:endo-1,4-beta-xylanase